MLNIRWYVAQSHTMNNCPALYANNSPNESFLEHSLMLKGVFKLGEYRPETEACEQALEGQSGPGQLWSHGPLWAPSLYVEASFWGCPQLGFEFPVHTGRAKFIFVNSRPIAVPTTYRCSIQVGTSILKGERAGLWGCSLSSSIMRKTKGHLPWGDRCYRDERNPET